MNEHELTQAYIDVAVWAAWLICVVICFLKGKKYVAIASIAASIVDPIPIGGMYWHRIITQPLMWLPFIAAIRLGRPDSRWSNWFYRREKLKRSILKYNSAVHPVTFRKAAEQNDAGAQNNLGVCYRDGVGVARDYVEAVKWFRKAAEQNLATAQYNLGLCYTAGQGVTQDYVEAVKWYRKAAEQNDAEAQYNLGNCYKDGQGVAKDEVEAVKWFRKAAEQSLADAQYNLGICYYYGVGMAKDYVEGYKWLLLAAAQGYGRAKEGMTLLENQMTREQIAVAQKLTRNFKAPTIREQFRREEANTRGA